MLIKTIYHKLHSHFGPQHWWPVTLNKETIPKYHKNIKLNVKQKLEICFGAILTQNTNWKNVEKAIIQLNKNQLIDIEKILKINNKKLALIIKSSGYHNQKAKKLKNFCQYLNKNYNNDLKELFKKNIGELRNELLDVNGIGPETADSMILYAAKKPIFVVDAYTKRIMNRVGFKENTYEELQELFMDNLELNEKLFNEYHALLVELGKNICKKKPLCEECPISAMCNYYNKK
jgi:endonuclease-3 related protein